MGAVHIACATDERYLPHCAAMLCSAADQHSEGLTAYCLVPAGQAAMVQPMAAMLEARGSRFQTVEISTERVAGLAGFDRFPVNVWFRALLPDVLPDLDRVLYLDADTLVLDRLDALWQEPLDGVYLAAVDNVLERRFASRPAELGLPAGQRYFNDGVLLLNLDLCRRDQVTKALCEYGRAHASHMSWGDQDAFNVVLGSHRRRLHPRWNCQNSVFFLPERRAVFSARELEEATTRPALLHFEGPELVKPWTATCRHPFRDRYLHYRAQTPWPLDPVDASAWDLIVRHAPWRLLPMTVRLRQRLAPPS